MQRWCDADAYRRGGLPRPPGVGGRITSVRPLPCTHQRMSRTRRRGRRPRRPFRRMTDDVGPTLRTNGARAVPAGYDTWGGGRYREHRGKCGCNRSRRTFATGQPWQTRNAGWARRWGGARNRRRRSSDGGAPGTVRPTARDVAFSNNPTSSFIQRKGRRGRRPLRWVRDSGFSGAVRHSFSYPLRFYAATSVALLHVGCTVLGAPWLRDRWVALDAVVRPDRFYPRFPRRANLASTTQHMQSRGHSPRTIGAGVRGYPSTEAGRAWKPAPTVRVGKVSACNRHRPSSEGGASGTPPLTGGLYTSRCGI